MNRLQEKFEKEVGYLVLPELDKMSLSQFKDKLNGYNGKFLIRNDMEYKNLYISWLETYHTNKVDEIFTDIIKELEKGSVVLCTNDCSRVDSLREKEIFIKKISTLKSKLKE